MSKQYLIPPQVRIGLSRIEAAELIGVSPVLFDQMVADGRMPPARQINSRKVWKRQEVEKWFDDLPYAGSETHSPGSAGEWTVA